MPSIRHAMLASALVVLAMTAAVYIHTSRTPRAPVGVRRTGGVLPPANATHAPKIEANVSAWRPVLAVPLVPQLPRGAPFWVSNASAQAKAPNKTAPAA